MSLPVIAPLPTFLQVEPVGQCNLRCQMCPIQFRRDGPPHGPPAFMKWELYVRLLEQFPGLRRLQLQGIGEPMMHPRFFDMIEYASRRGLDVSTNTNSTFLNPTRAERCVTSGLSELHASLDGATAKVFEAIRVRARFERVIDNLRHLMAARARLGSETPRVRIVCVAMRQNLAELPSLVRLAADLGVRAIFVQHLCHDFREDTLPKSYAPMRQFVDDQSLLGERPETVARWFDEAAATARQFEVELRLPTTIASSPRPARDLPRCDWPWTGAYVAYDGKTMPCCMVATPDRATLGDLATDSVADVWNGAAYRAFRGDLNSTEPPTICQSCSIYQGTF